MNFIKKFIVQFLPTRDIKILELRRIIKNQKERIAYLEKQSSGISIQFYDDEIEDEIIRNLQEAKNEICIAMAWFTSKNIMKVLNELKNRGVDIKIIIDNNRINGRNNNLRLWNSCNILKMVDVNRPGSKYNNYMHNKYCIIDDITVIDGSYNWSENAKYNLEHIIVIKDENTVKKYKQGFYKIFNNPRYYANYTITENVV